MSGTGAQVKLLRRHGREIVHLRQLLEKKRLGLVLGAGISQAAGLPGWKGLLDRVTKDMLSQGIPNRDISKEDLPVRAQMLLARLRAHIEARNATLDGSQLRALVATTWLDLVRHALYRGFSVGKKMLRAHPYAAELASVALGVPVVVSYNYDDILEQALATHPLKGRDTAGYYSAWGSSFVIQDGRPVVYHPNGYVPFDYRDRYSEQIILTAEALSDQVIDSMSGSYSLLLHYYATTPSLFLGFSLDDQAMQNMLRQATRRCPGIVHYYVKFCSPRLATRERKELRETNFDLYNMVTLFITKNEYPHFLRLLAEIPQEDFEDLCSQAGVHTRFLHYVTGPVSVGKTTALSRIQGVYIVDEWLSQREPLIARRSDTLTRNQRARVDKWILNQLRLKNAKYANATLGLHIMDRAPLDAFAFVPRKEHRSKAQEMWDVACVGGSGKPMPFEAGAIILLTGKPDDLSDRQRWRGRQSTSEYISKQQAALVDVYGSSTRGCTIIDTKGLQIEAVVKKVLRCLYMESYVPYDLNDRLRCLREAS